MCFNKRNKSKSLRLSAGKTQRNRSIYENKPLKYTWYYAADFNNFSNCNASCLFCAS